MNYLYVGATAEADPDGLLAVEESLGAAFHLPVRRIEMPSVDFALDPRRNQYASTAVLEMLSQVCPGDAVKLIGVTSRDLFIPVLTFVFGQAQLSGRVAVVSLARLRQEFYGLAPNSDVFLRRARKEALHEAGHTFGLVHCADRACAMSLSTGIQQIDRKKAGYCAACAALLDRRSRR